MTIKFKTFSRLYEPWFGKHKKNVLTFVLIHFSHSLRLVKGFGCTHSRVDFAAFSARLNLIVASLCTSVNH